MSQSSTPQPTPDAKLAAVRASQVALIAFLAALLSGALAFGASLWSAKIAADSSARTISTQLTGETEKSRAEFLRGQRQALYSSVASHEQTLVDEEVLYYGNIADATRTELDRLIANGDKHQDQYLVLRKDRFAMDIVGSVGTRSSFSALLEEHHALVRALFELTKARRGAVPTQLSAESLDREVLDRQQRVQDLEERFKAAARADMGAE